MKQVLKKVLMVVVVVLIVAGIAWWARGNYKKALALDINMKTSWSDVESELNNRYDLLPNLIEQIKMVAKEDSDLLQAIDSDKKAYSQADQMATKLQAAQKLEGDIVSLASLEAKYPKLKTTDDYRKILEELSGSEKGILFEKKKYNDNVKLFKKYQGSLPGRIFLRIAGLSDRTYSEISILDNAGPTK